MNYLGFSNMEVTADFLPRTVNEPVKTEQEYTPSKTEVFPAIEIKGEKATLINKIPWWVWLAIGYITYKSLQD